MSEFKVNMYFKCEQIKVLLLNHLNIMTTRSRLRLGKFFLALVPFRRAGFLFEVTLLCKRLISAPNIRLTILKILNYQQHPILITAAT